MTRTQVHRKQLKDDFIQQVVNEIEDALFLYTPEAWPDTQLDRIEHRVLDETRHMVKELPTDVLASVGVLRMYVGQAISHTKRLIREQQEHTQ